MFADRLYVNEITTLVRTTRALNWLLNPYMYRRAKDTRSWRGYGRPYFLRAVEAGNLTAVRHFIEVGTLVNMSDPTDTYHPTALHRCVCGGYIEIAQLLIQHGVNMSPVNEFGETPLYHAIGRKLEETWVTLLVDAGADIFASSEMDETILSAATKRGSLSTVQLLLGRGAMPTTRNRRGNTMLHDVTLSRNAEVFGFLLEAGLNIEATDNDGKTPLHYAAECNRTDCVIELLQRGANVDAIDIRGCTPLQTILQFGHSKSAARHILHHETLPEECASKGSQACVPGCLFGESAEPVVDVLLSAGADIRASRNNTCSPLDWAAHLLNVNRCRIWEGEWEGDR
jgi:hypothetical protein